MRQSKSEIRSLKSETFWIALHHKDAEFAEFVYFVLSLRTPRPGAEFSDGFSDFDHLELFRISDFKFGICVPSAYAIIDIAISATRSAAPGNPNFVRRSASLSMTFWRNSPLSKSGRLSSMTRSAFRSD